MVLFGGHGSSFLFWCPCAGWWEFMSSWVVFLVTDFVSRAHNSWMNSSPKDTFAAASRNFAGLSKNVSVAKYRCLASYYIIILIISHLIRSSEHPVQKRLNVWSCNIIRRGDLPYGNSKMSILCTYSNLCIRTFPKFQCHPRFCIWIDE